MNDNKALLFALLSCGLVFSFALAMHGAPASSGTRSATSDLAAAANEKTQAGNLLRKLEVVEKGIAGPLAQGGYDGEHEVAVAMRDLRSCIQAAREAARELLADDWDSARQSGVSLDTLDAAVERANEQFNQACSRSLRPSPAQAVAHGWADGGVPRNETARIAVATFAASELIRKLDILETGLAVGIPQMESNGDHELAALARDVERLIRPSREVAREFLAAGSDAAPALIAKLDGLNAELQRKNAAFQEAYSRWLRSRSSLLRVREERSWTDERGNTITESQERAVFDKLRFEIESEANPYLKAYLEGVEESLLRERAKVRAVRGW